MKTPALLLGALALLAGACTQPAVSNRPESFAAVPAGTLQTAWGELPTYQVESGKSPSFAFDRRRIRDLVAPVELREAETVVLDVLVNRDGSIRDVKVQTSSGTTRIDQFTMNCLVGAKLQLQLAATDPAPYVIRYTHRWSDPSWGQ